MKLIELSGNEWNPVGLGSPEPAKATPLSKIPEAKDWLVYKNQGAIRSQPLKGELVDAMSFLPELGVTMEVFSGGQPSDGVHGVDRTGSHRHDHGGSGDVFFYKDGRRMDWANEADLPIFTEIVRRARRNGITGIGAGPGYMQPGSMHIGFGNEAVWGAGGKGANAPEWLKSAYNSYDQDTPPRTGQATTAPDIGRRIMSDMMRDFGLTREQAAAFAGNFDHESGGFKYLQEINPQVPGSRGGFGFAMWTGPRRKRFEEYVEANNLDPASYKANYGFLKHEIQNDPYEAKQFAKVLNAKTVDEATKAVSDLYLRPGTPNIQSRLERAQAYLDGDDTVSIATHDGAVDPGQANKQIELSPEEWKPVGAEPWKAADTSPVETPTADLSTSQTPPPQNQKLQDQFDALEKDAPGRYMVIPEDQYETWKADWDAQNQSSGVVGDTKRLLNAGWAGLGLGVREAVNAIPGVGDDIVYALDSVDEWMNGQKSEAYLGGQIDKAVATLTPATREARGKHWWDEEKNRPGAAWSDPRSYFAGVVESLPSMAATMGPSMTLARGAYVSAIASGASQRVAAASAARTAMVAGAVSEGIIGGGQAALSVRQQIEQMPRQALEESAAVKQLMESGMSIDEAVDAIADDAATQAFVIAGTATGVFGGFGDRVLAKIVADGVGGNIAQRIVQGAVREGVAEGVLEEAPQEALSQLGENIAMKNTVDPDRDVTEGVANAAAGGVAVGGAMGAGMGAGGAAMSPRTPDSGFTPDITPKKGVLAEAMDHGARETAAAAGSTFIINDPAFDDSPAGPLNGVEVALASDQSGIAQGMKRVTLPDGKTHVVGQRLLLPKEPVNMAPPQADGETTASDVAAVSEDIPEGAPAAGTDVRIKLPDGAEIMARVEGYADGEAIVMDAGTGEVLQVPLSDIELSPAAAAAEPVVVAKEQRSQQGEPIPEDVPGTEPIPQEQTTGELPPPSESAPVADVPYRIPQPGQRVIVAAEGIERFPGTVQSYEDGAEEALIRRDDGSEVQVPVSDLRVSKLTDKQIEKQELKENPPVERETITDKEPTAREVVSKQVLLPDTKHARLYDLGKLRRDSKRTIGAGTLDMDAVSPGEQSRLADEFGVSSQRLGQIADDYRYRVERAAKDAKSRLPFKMWPVNEKMLGRMKDEDRKEADTDAGFPVPEPMDEGTKVLENDWDKLPVEARKAVLTAAKVKRAPSTRWADFPANIRKKLEASLQVSTSDEAVPEVTPVQEVTAAPVTPPSFEDFKASLPKDAEGYPDLTGVGSAVIGENSDGTTTAWNGLKTDEQRAKAIALANERTAAKPKPADTLETAAQEAATSPANDRPEPTQAQKEAGNYKLGHVKLGGFDISIENPQGSERKGVDPNGKPWSVTMKSHYGYFKGTVGKDKDHIDTFIRPGTETLADSDPVFVIDQVNPDTKRFDEHKIMLGFKTRQAAERAYKENYAKGWKGLGTIVRTNVGELKDWFANGDTSKPFTKRGQPTDQPSATKSEKQPDLSTKTPADTNGGLNSEDVKSVLRSKEWKKVFGSTTNVNAETDFYAHPESAVAFDQAAGWLDAKAGRPPREQKPFTPVHSSAFNPRNAYLEAYWGAKHGEARTVRASEAVDVQRELTDEKPQPPSEGKSAFAGNKLFTEDKVVAARKRLRQKFGQINSGIDPEMLIDGMTIAGAYIESGVRKFPDYAKAMVKDLGPAVRPFLLSFYEGARNYPGLDTAGMDSVEDAKAAFDAMTGKPAAETKNDNAAASPRNVQSRPERKSPEPVPGDGASRGTLDLFGQPNGPVERERERSPQSSDRSGEKRSKPAVSGQRSESSTGPEQQVPERGGNRDGTGSGTDRKPEPARRNYRVTEGELTRKGSWLRTAQKNVQIVELIKRLENEGRAATADERALMVQFTGWGASEIANGVFPNRNGQYKDDTWRGLGERLKAALSDEDYKTAARSTQYAHYTSESVIRSIYDGLKRFGFAGGQVLEPGMGIGHFLGVMPANMAGTSQYTGIEFDGVTAAIAKHLYPDSRVTHGDYTKTKLPKGYFDLAIGNPPFAQTKITNDPEYRKYGFSLHDYFFAKTIDRVKPGGLMVFVTSRYTMDKVRDAGRRYLADRANLLGAIRLPQTAFQANAGTEVVTDVLFLQKRGPGIEDNGVSWTDTKEITVGENVFTVNEYIADHPEMVLGSHAATGTMYRKNDYTVSPDKSKDIEAAFAGAIENLPEAIYKPERGSEAEKAKVIEKDFDPKAKKEGGLYLSDSGELMIRQDGVGQAFTERQTSTGKLKPLSKKEAQFLKDFVSLRDAVKQTQFDQLTDGDWEKSLAAARKSYQDLVKRNGNILAYSTIERTDDEGNTQSYKRFKNEPLFMIDPDGPLAFTLEKITESGDIVEGAIFNGRVLNKPSDPEIVTTQDAMFVSLDKLGRFDLADVAKRAGRSEEETIADLATSIYEDPGDGWVLADEYLSGNVVQKLAEARAAADMDPKYARNVDALLAVQPRPLGPTEIDVKLGAPWLPASDIEEFAREVIGKDMTITHNVKVGTWQVSGDKSTIGEFAMDNFPAADILNKILNNSQLRVTRATVSPDGKKSTETDPEGTEKLNDIARKIKDRFRAWIWKDAARSKRLVNFYNDNYNNIAPRQFDGSHLTLPGTSLRFNLHPHQKRSIWRAIQTGDTYLAHAVGAGKTFEMIAIGMEERRLGLSKKPLFAVPNHMLGQFQREFLELYPAANIMVADEKNFHTSNRRKFIAQAALNDPDAIIITHSAFGRIGLSDDTNDKQIQDLIDEWKELQEEIEAAEGKGLSFKRTQSQIERLEKRLQGKQKREAKDQVMTFEELGVDRLLIDELHEFRKLDFVTNQGSVKGIDPQGSQRAMDLYSKVTYLREKNPDPKRVLVGASGTPVTNTMGELFTVQRLFQPEVLEDIGAHNFDAWAAQFGDIVEGLEQNAAGKFETVSRFARFQNVPELMRRVRTFMDILTSNSLGQLVQRPTRINPPREIKTTPTPQGYKSYQDSLNSRINAIRQRKGPPKKGEDIILKVIADGRFSAIDMRFVHPEQASDPDSKLNQLIDDVIADYRATANNEYAGVTSEKDPLKGSTLVIFADIGLGDAVVKSRGFDMKGWIEKRFTDAGIPKDHFAFIRDHKAHAKKERLFADLREGRKRILIGGKDMETGVNVQKRLTHLYHLDAPWFPASVEQREGRADRQGNQNEDIVIRAYATKGSYDSTMWSMNARKARFIEQALNGDETVRKMEDVSEASAFEMAAALSSGDPRYLQLAGLRQEVERLGRLRKAHFDEQNRYKREEHYEESGIGRLKTSRTEHEAAISKGHRIEAGKFSATVGKKSYDKRDDWAKDLYAAFRNEAESGTVGKTTLGKIGGHDVDFYGDRYDDGSHKAELAIELPGDLPLLAVHPTAEDITVAGIGQRAVNQVNSIFEKPGELSIKIEQAERRLKQIRSQIGAPFPEESLFLEKQGELSELELELQSEKETAGPTEAEKAGSVRDAVKARDEEATADERSDDVEVDQRFSKSMGQQGRSSDLRAELTKGQTGAFFEQLLNSGIVRIVETRPADLPGDVQAWTDPDGTITLVAPAISEGTGTAVLLHEALHAGRGALVERKVWQALEKRLASLYRQHNRSAGRAKEFFDAARDRVEAAGVQEKDRVEEFGAYAIEEYEKAPKILQRWVDDAIGAVKSWVLRRFGRQLGAITPAQLRALAISALKDRARPDPVSNVATGEPRGVMFSRKVDKAEVKDQIAGRWTDLSPKLLSLVPLNYFEEMKRPGMNAVTKYMKVKRSMDTYRSEKHEAMDKVAQDWRKFASRNRKGAAELASLMHDSTRMSVDPSITYEGKEPGGYFALKARFDALPPAARALYKTVRNSYVRMQKEMDQLILDNVDKAQKINEKEAKKRYDSAKQKLDRDRTIDELERREKAEELAAKYKADLTKSRWAAKARLTRLRQTFEKNRVPAPYFPLARFGDYFVSVRDMAGDIVSFSRFESDADRRRWLRANKAEIEGEYPGVVFDQGVLGNSAAVRQAMDPRLVAEIDSILKDANVDAEVMDAIYQKWLQSMPDLSVRKRYIHRKGTSGFHQDALRAFASHMFHAGHQMGKLKYGIDLQEAVDDARDQAKGSDDPTRAGQLVNELSLRHEWVMNPKGSKFAQKVNSAAFVWYLAATPAAAIINMTQPILFGIPILGAKLGGVTKASAALMKASTDVMYGKGDIINGRLTSDEKRAIKDLYASGSIDRTMAMEIAGIGDSGVAYSPLRHSVMTKISWMFHRAEVVNREVTALAAYRMARAKGMSHEKAVDVAHELNFTVNYDYANSSRPRILQSDFAKVAGVFMSYQLNVWYRIFRDIHQSFAGDTPQARKEARYQLAGLMGVQTLIGGTSGFFGYNVLMALAGMFFDDDDDPFSFKHEAERAIYDLFGANVGGMIINGVPGHLTGVDLTSRIGMADFFLRMPEGSKEGKDWWLEFVAGSLGASVGAVGNAIVGMHYMSEGDTARGLELIAPKAIKDAMKAWRYNNEGLLTRKGDIILPREDINAWNVIAQMSGFTPAKISMAHKLRGRKYEAQNRIKEERSALINRFATSIRNGDVDARKRVIEQIKAWNKRSYAKVLPITKETLERSLKTRARLSARREDGFLPINEKIGHYLSQRTPENPYR